MGEFLEAIKQRYFKPKNIEIADKMSKQKVKNTILSLCEQYLQNDGDKLTFEALKGDLPFVLEAINEEPLKSRYIITQVSENMFEAMLVEVDLGL